MISATACLLPIRIDSRLEDDEDVIVEVAGQGRLDLEGLLRFALRVAGEGNDVRDGFVDDLRSGIYDG